MSGIDLLIGLRVQLMIIINDRLLHRYFDDNFGFTDLYYTG